MKIVENEAAHSKKQKSIRKKYEQLTVGKWVSITSLFFISLSFSAIYCKWKYTLHETAQSQFNLEISLSPYSLITKALGSLSYLKATQGSFSSFGCFLSLFQ